MSLSTIPVTICRGHHPGHRRLCQPVQTAQKAWQQYYLEVPYSGLWAQFYGSLYKTHDMASRYKNALSFLRLFIQGEMTMLRVYFLLVLHVFLLAPLRVCADQNQAVRFGSVAEDTPAVMHQRLTPLTDYLEAAIGRPVVLVLSPDMPTVIKALSNGDVELAYLTPVAYLNAYKLGNATLVAKVVTDNQAYFHLDIVVREDSPIKTVADLAGKSFAFGDPSALLQRAVVVNAGMPLEKLGKHAFLGHYDNIARGVLNRDYDAGIVTDSKSRLWNQKGLRVIYRSESLPPYNISANSRIDQSLLLKLQNALLSLDGRNPDQRRALDALGKDYNGFAQTNDAEYDIIRKLIKPFQR